MKARKLAALALAAFAATAAAAATKWSPIRENAAAKLFVDEASVSRKGQEVRFHYRVDFAKPQGGATIQLSYRSVTTEAILRCQARTISLQQSELYAGPGATGTVLATTKPTPREARFMPIEKGSSDEDLWRHLCAPKGKKS